MWIDATLTPAVSARRGASLDTEIRYLEPNHRGEDNWNYLPYDGLAHRPRFSLVMQNESAFGIAPNCDFQSQYWLAVSATRDPSGKWFVYHFDVRNIIGDVDSASDYPGLGFNPDAIFIGANQWDRADGSSGFL